MAPSREVTQDPGRYSVLSSTARVREWRQRHPEKARERNRQGSSAIPAGELRRLRRWLLYECAEGDFGRFVAAVQSGRSEPLAL